VTKKTGKRLWMTSDERSMNKDTNPSATTVRGTLCMVATVRRQRL